MSNLHQKFLTTSTEKFHQNHLLSTTPVIILSITTIINMSFLKSAQSLKPLFDRVLVQRLKPATKTASGIYIPEKNQEKLNQGTVVAAGPGVANSSTGELIPTAVKAGDRVLLPNYGGSPVKVGEEEYLLYTDKEILAKIEDN
ncbi:chaperonin 10-like protein [Scheffersomyces amazonensis]|uniref:chaperonin 10-like protein n=1 Tax=Scheffersomyces amazonensis TaxID=1078765 RepID=UPI00315D88BE